jgi:hypothetical protein
MYKPVAVTNEEAREFRDSSRVVPVLNIYK